MPIAPNKGSYRLDQREASGPSAGQTVPAGLGRGSEPSVLGPRTELRVGSVGCWIADPEALPFNEAHGPGVEVIPWLFLREAEGPSLPPHLSIQQGGEKTMGGDV